MSLDFGKKLATCRKAKGLSQKELAKLLNTSHSVIGRYERSDITPSIDVVSIIADALEVSVDFLIGKTNLLLDKDAVDRLMKISELKQSLYS